MMTTEQIQAAKIGSADAALRFLLAGNAYTTLVSLKTGTRYTYRIAVADCQLHKGQEGGCQCTRRYFVSLLTGSDNTADYVYLGMIAQKGFIATKASRHQASGAPFLGFQYVWQKLSAGVYPPQCEIWHESRCGRCGRKLTVPESIATGLGPECAGKSSFRLDDGTTEQVQWATLRGRI